MIIALDISKLSVSFADSSFASLSDYGKIKAKSGGDNVHSVNYKDYLNLVLKGAGLCLFEVDVEKQRYVRFENAEAIYQVSGEKVLSDLEEFSSLTPDAL